MDRQPRAEVVGSLLRPEFLTSARKQLESGEIDPARFKEVEDRAVDEAVAAQVAAGIDVVTDGEQRRYAFFGHLVHRMAGVGKVGGRGDPFPRRKGEQVGFKSPVLA